MSGWHRRAQDLKREVKAGTKEILQMKINSYEAGGWKQVSEIRVVNGKPTVMMAMKNRKGA